MFKRWSYKRRIYENNVRLYRDLHVSDLGAKQLTNQIKESKSTKVQTGKEKRGNESALLSIQNVVDI